MLMCPTWLAHLARINRPEDHSQRKRVRCWSLVTKPLVENLCAILYLLICFSSRCLLSAPVCLFSMSARSWSSFLFLLHFLVLAQVSGFASSYRLLLSVNISGKEPDRQDVIELGLSRCKLAIKSLK